MTASGIAPAFVTVRSIVTVANDLSQLQDESINTISPDDGKLCVLCITSVMTNTAHELSLSNITVVPINFFYKMNIIYKK